MSQTDGQIGDLTKRWARFASDIVYERLPRELVAVTKGLVLDTIGTALAASTLGEGCGHVAGLIRANPGTPECTLWGYGDRVSSLLGAFGNGALAHALNFDALGPTGGHIGVAAVPASFVMAEKKSGVSGKEFLASVALAAEFTVRLAAALSAVGVDANEKFLEGQLLGYFGAAAGAARILRFDPERMESVLGFALMQAAGTRQVSLDGGAAKAIYGAYTNHGAILSVLLAEQGLDARCAALEGPAGLYSAFYRDRYDPTLLSHGLGETFWAVGIDFKRWPTSMVIRPFIEACLDLRSRHRIDPAAIEHIHVQAPPHCATWLDPARRRPNNAATAANSIFFGVAKTLANGNVTLADFTPAGLAQREALDLAAAIGFAMDESIGDGAAVEITLRDGTVWKSTVRAPWSSPNFDELIAKFRDCAQYAARPLSAARLEQLVERLARLELTNDMQVIADCLNG